MKQTYIWGAGYYGTLAAFDCEQKGIKAAGFIDSNASQIKHRLGLPVLTFEQISLTIKPEIIIAIQNEKAIKQISEILKTKNLDFEIFKFPVQNNYNYYTNPKRNSKEPPPSSTIPEHLYNDFTMNGQIPVLYWYLDERNDSKFHNSAEDYKKAFERFENRSFEYYGKDINSFYAAFEKYNFNGKSVLIWGLAGLNCEAMALWQGAEHVYVVDYNKPVCEHERITVMNHEELVKSGIKTDIAISFSSFEHDGLGRYGDPLNPNGDLRAMQVAGNLLKDDGYLWLGVPQGEDCLVWNAHRIYGGKRLPLLLEGWNIEAVFEQESPNKQPLGAWNIQPLMILKRGL
ncbi:MAG: DUF268 domain-containing protein [Chitinispirillales bacterium]|jgi:hypothetical protein|nr:DUF268 domain-containing protein [Chitinispirillales bacterium]